MVMVEVGTTTIRGEKLHPSNQINLISPQKLLANMQVEPGTIKESACGRHAR